VWCWVLVRGRRRDVVVSRIQVAAYGADGSRIADDRALGHGAVHIDHECKAGRSIGRQGPDPSRDRAVLASRRGGAAPAAIHPPLQQGGVGRQHVRQSDVALVAGAVVGHGQRVIHLSARYDRGSGAAAGGQIRGGGGGTIFVSADVHRVAHNAGVAALVSSGQSGGGAVALIDGRTERPIH